MKTLEAAAKKKKKPAAKKGAKKKEQDERFVSRFTDPKFGYKKKEEVKEKESEKKEKKEITEHDERFPLNKFKGKTQTSRGAPVRKGQAKKRDLTSVKEPQGINEYYKQLRTNQGQDVEDDDEDEASVALSQAEDVSEGSSQDFDEEASLGSDIYDEHANELTEDATKRLALRNCDWDNLDASHIYALMQSFMPMGGALMGINIYTSELGKEHLKQEREKGPSLWVKPGDEDEHELPEEIEEPEELTDDEDEEDEEHEFDIGFSTEDPAVRTEIGTDGERFSENRYRRYEIQRLKYYYAIVEFDSAATAAHVYKECDGTEIEHSGTIFDLSFVPDEMEFTDEPKDSCSQLGRGFKANTGFVTNALQNSKFAISWDQTDPKRRQAIQSMFASDDYRDDDLDAYLAPCQSSDEEEGVAPSKEKIRKIRSKYACLFEGVGGLTEDIPNDEENEDAGEESSEESSDAGVHAEWSDDDVDEEEAARVQQELEGMPSDEEGEEGAVQGVTGDMSSTIHIGAKEGSKNLKDVLKVKQDREGETIWEKRLRKKKESRKLAKKERMNAHEGGEDEVEEEDKEEQRRKIKEALGDDAVVPERRPKIGKKEKRKAHKARVVAAAAQERDAKREERGKLLSSKAKKVPEKEVQEEPKAQSKLMSRFGKLADPRFQTDPNHPKYQDTRAMQELVSDVRATRKRKAVGEDGATDLSSKVSYFNKKAKQG